MISQISDKEFKLLYDAAYILYRFIISFLLQFKLGVLVSFSFVSDKDGYNPLS